MKIKVMLFLFCLWISGMVYAKAVLTIIAYSSFALDPKIIQAFEEQHNVKVQLLKAEMGEKC